VGLVAGAVYFSGTLYWLVETMTTFGGLPVPLAVFAAGLLVAYLALFPAIFTLVIARAARAFGERALLLVAPVWVTTELGVSTSGTGSRGLCSATARCRICRSSRSPRSSASTACRRSSRWAARRWLGSWSDAAAGAGCSRDPSWRLSPPARSGVTCGCSRRRCSPRDRR